MTRERWKAKLCKKEPVKTSFSNLAFLLENLALPTSRHLSKAPWKSRPTSMASDILITTRKQNGRGSLHERCNALKSRSMRPKFLRHESGRENVADAALLRM